MTQSTPQRRLLLIVPWLSTGGADKFNLDLVGQLTRRGFEVTIVTTGRGDHSWLPFFAEHTSSIVQLADSVPHSEYPRRMVDLLHAGGIDVVMISHSEIGYLLLPYLRAQAPTVVFVDYCHVVEPGWRNGGYARLAVENESLLDLTIVSSQHLKSWVVSQGADANRIEVVYTGIDAELWKPDPEVRSRIRAELSLSDAPMVFYAGRLSAQKQPRVLARTVEWLRDQRVPCVTVVAGDGPEADGLSNYVHERRLDAEVRLLGCVSNARTRELMAASDVFFLPSAYEGIALSIFEAMACGVVPVSADVGGQNELVEPDCGVLIAKGTETEEVERYGGVLAALLGEPARRQLMGEEARLRVREHFSLSQMAAGMEQALTRATQLHANAPRPQPSLETANKSVAKGLRTVGQIERAERLWAQRDPAARNVRAYGVLARHFAGWYRWGTARGWRWLKPLRARIRLAMLGRP